MKSEECKQLPIGTKISIYMTNNEMKSGNIYRYQLKGITIKNNDNLYTVLWKEIKDCFIIEKAN